jgi:hypothetical protein
MTTVYQIPGWDHHFENFKSRTIDACGYVAMPNKQHGLGLTRILAEPDGAAVFGIWCLILQAASRQERPRAGWLTENGRADGAPWDIDDMALRWRRPVAEVRRAIDVLTSAKVGWLTACTRETVKDAPAGTVESIQHPSGIRAVSAEYPLGALEGKEGKEGKEQHPNARDISTDQEIDTPAPVEPPTGNDSDLWRYRIGAEPWARTLKRAGCKIGPNNWRAWQGLIERTFAGQVDTCAAAAAKVKPEDRWPDQVEAAARTVAPSAIASKYADRQARIKTVQVTP